ncbi:MAG: hypothetical protein MHPSP_004854, partial [Paramarteilia canceri]
QTEFKKDNRGLRCGIIALDTDQVKNTIQQAKIFIENQNFDSSYAHNCSDFNKYSEDIQLGFEKLYHQIPEFEPLHEILKTEMPKKKYRLWFANNQMSKEKKISEFTNGKKDSRIKVSITDEDSDCKPERCGYSKEEQECIFK